jgi:hypothetical protein
MRDLTAAQWLVIAFFILLATALVYAAYQDLFVAERAMRGR